MKPTMPARKAGLGLLACVLAGAAVARPVAKEAIPIDDDIAGVVTGPRGPEAGV